MAEERFSRNEIRSLVDKLSTLSLSDSEQRLLLAIFAVAAGHARQPARAGEVDVPAEATLADLREQVIQSFVPASGEAFLLDNPSIDWTR